MTQTAGGSVFPLQREQAEIYFDNVCNVSVLCFSSSVKRIIKHKAKQCRDESSPTLFCDIKFMIRNLVSIFESDTKSLL